MSQHQEERGTPRHSPLAHVQLWFWSISVGMRSHSEADFSGNAAITFPVKRRLLLVNWIAPSFKMNQQQKKKFIWMSKDTEPQIAPEQLVPCMAASTISVWMCVWMGECDKCCTALWAFSRLEKCYRNSSPFTMYKKKCVDRAVGSSGVNLID